MAFLHTPVLAGTYSITNDKNGFTATYAAIVTQLDSDIHQRLFDAEHCPGLPPLFAAHPVIPNIFLKSKKPTFEEGQLHIARVVLTYGVKEEGEDEDENAATFSTLEIINSTTTQESNLDKDGNDITVSALIARPELGAGLVVEDRVEQAGFYQRQVNQLVIRASRREALNGITKSFEFNDKINSAPFAGKPAGTFLAIVTGRAVLSGAEWDMNYEFRFNKDGWDPTVFFKDSATGAPAENLEEGVGIKTPEVYERIDFNQLGLL